MAPQDTSLQDGSALAFIDQSQSKEWLVRRPRSASFEYHARRSVVEHPSLRRLFAAASGPDRILRIEQDFAAHDAWENEGGAGAYED